MAGLIVADLFLACQATVGAKMPCESTLDAPSSPAPRMPTTTSAMNRHGWSVSLVALVAVSVVASGCASSGASPHRFPGRVTPAVSQPGGDVPAVAPADPAAPTPAVTSPLSDGPAPANRAFTDAPLPLVSAVMEEALSLQGVRYRGGGAAPGGFDCSGFVQYVFGRVGLKLPRSTRDQYRSGEGVDAADARPGDLVFFSTTGPGATHVGILIEPDLFIHAPNQNSVVRVDRLSQAYWSQRFIGIRRVLAE